MYYRARELIKRRLQRFALRIKCWNLPPVATHLACFLLGTLLFEADGAGRVPSGILVPWSRARVEGGLHVTQEYELRDARRDCRLIPESFKIWQAEPKKIFVIVAKTRLLAETMTAMQRSDARLSLHTPRPLPHCEKKNVIIYP